MAMEHFRVPLPTELVNAVRAEATRVGAPTRAVIAAFFVECFGEWQGRRMERDFAAVAEVMSLDVLMDPNKT